MRERVSPIALAPPVDHAADNLSGHGASEGKGDEFPAEPGFDAEINDEWDGYVDVEVPAEGELLVPLSKVAAGEVYDEGEQYKSEYHQKGMHCPPLAAWYVMSSLFVNGLDLLQ